MKCNKNGPCEDQEMYDRTHHEYNVDPDGSCAFCGVHLLSFGGSNYWIDTLWKYDRKLDSNRRTALH